MKKKDIKEQVKKVYGDIAKTNSPCCAPTPNLVLGASVEDYMKNIGYSEEDLESVSREATLGLGCGNPVALASLKGGEVILDLGSGAGFDAFLAAKAVGEEGRVIGVDMTVEMVEKAKENAKKGGFHNVEFRLGEIEELPISDSSVDVIISNCVINLSPDKERVFKEAYRVLRPGGRLMISDIVVTEPLPEFIRHNIEAYTGCIAGASLKEDYLKAIEKAGFAEVTIVSSAKADFLSWSSCGCGLPGSIAKSIQSIKVSAKKY